jgi:hypothetical protein
MTKKPWEILIEEAQKREAIRDKLLGTNEHDYVGEFRAGVAPVRDDKIWYYVDAHNKPIFGRTFKFAGIFVKGRAHVQDDKGWVYIRRHDGRDIYPGRTLYGENNLLLAFLTHREIKNIQKLLIVFLRHRAGKKKKASRHNGHAVPEPALK